MPVPSLISDLTTTAITNSPAGSESAKGNVDDYIRAHAAFIRQLSDVIQGATVTLPSASTVNIGFAGTSNIAITGTTTINGFDVHAEGAIRYVQFQGAMTLTYNAASMILPGAASITTVSGDVGVFKSLGAGKWVCLAYQRQAGYITAAQVPGLIANTSPSFTRVLLAAGSVTAPSLSFSSDPGSDTGFYQSADGIINIVCNGVAVGRFVSTGLEVIKVTQTT